MKLNGNISVIHRDKEAADVRDLMLNINLNNSFFVTTAIGYHNTMCNILSLILEAYLSRNKMSMLESSHTEVKEFVWFSSLILVYV